jgi:adenylosuccinate synthase
VVVAYSHALNGFTSLNLTKLDVLDELETVKIATGYRVHGKALPQGAFPSTLEDLSAAEVEYITMPGWQSSTRGITNFAELPANARAYVKRIEEVTGVPVAYIGTGQWRLCDDGAAHASLLECPSMRITSPPPPLLPSPCSQAQGEMR